MFRGSPAQSSFVDGLLEDNTFYSTAVLAGVDSHGSFRRSKTNFVRLAVLVADDADPTHLNGALSYLLETSPGKFQLGLLLDPTDPDTRDLDLIDAVMQAMASASLIKADRSGNNAVRYVRLPVGSNTKARESGDWRVRVVTFDPQVRYSLDDAVAVFGLDLDAIRAGMSAPADPAPAGPGADWATLYASLSADADADRAYHDALLKLSSKMVAAGMSGGAVVESLRGLMLAVRPTQQSQLARWESRFAEIPRLVAGAEKFRTSPVEISLTERDGLLLDLAALRDATRNVRWLVKSIVPADSMGMLFGASGTFKSFVALDLCFAVTHSLNWCGRRSQAGPVVFVAAEGGAGVYRRVAAWHQSRGLEFPSTFHVCVTPLLLTQEEQVAALRESIAALPAKPALIVVDTLSQTFSGDENSSTDIANYLRLLNTHLRATFRSTVLVVHHTGHSAAERPRGSSAITANLDFLLGVFRPDPDSLAAQLEVVKQKDGDKIPAQHFELSRYVVGQDDDGEEISSLVAEWHDPIRAIQDSAVKLNEYERAIVASIMPGQVAHEDDMKDASSAYAPEGAEAKRKAWTRAMTKLHQNLRLIRPAGAKLWRRA